MAIAFITVIIKRFIFSIIMELQNQVINNLEKDLSFYFFQRNL